MTQYITSRISNEFAHSKIGEFQRQLNLVKLEIINNFSRVRFRPRILATIIFISSEIFRSCHPSQNYFSHKVAFDVQSITFLIWRKINVSFWRYLDFCKMHELQNIWRYRWHCCTVNIQAFSGRHFLAYCTSLA